jgi:hypothetical protein
MQVQVRALNYLNNAARCSYSGLNRGFMKRLFLLIAKLVPLVCLLLVSIAGWTQDEKNKSDIEKRIDNAAKVLDENGNSG